MALLRYTVSSRYAPPKAKNVGLPKPHLMEFGALFCTARKPQCETCPLSAHCRARTGVANALAGAPRKAKAGNRYEDTNRFYRERVLLRLREALKEGVTCALWAPGCARGSLRRTCPGSTASCGAWRGTVWRPSLGSVRRAPPTPSRRIARRTAPRMASGTTPARHVSGCRRMRSKGVVPNRPSPFSRPSRRCPSGRPSPWGCSPCRPRPRHLRRRLRRRPLLHPRGRRLLL
jgi:hypothetical protein